MQILNNLWAAIFGGGSAPAETTEAGVFQMMLDGATALPLEAPPGTAPEIPPPPIERVAGEGVAIQWPNAETQRLDFLPQTEEIGAIDSVEITIPEEEHFNEASDLPEFLLASPAALALIPAAQAHLHVSAASSYESEQTPSDANHPVEPYKVALHNVAGLMATPHQKSSEPFFDSEETTPEATAIGTEQVQVDLPQVRTQVTADALPSPEQIEAAEPTKLDVETAKDADNILKSSDPVVVAHESASSSPTPVSALRIENRVVQAVVAELTEDTPEIIAAKEPLKPEPPQKILVGEKRIASTEQQGNGQHLQDNSTEDLLQKVKPATQSAQSEAEFIDKNEVVELAEPADSQLLARKEASFLEVPASVEVKHPASQQAKPLVAELTDQPREIKAVFKQITDRIEILAARPREAVTIHLTPEHLGSVTLTVKAIGNTIDAQITATDSNVKQALDQNQGHLAVQLETRGYAVNQITVSSQTGSALDAQNRQSSQHQNQQAPQGRSAPTHQQGAMALNDQAQVRQFVRNSSGVDLWI